MDTVFCLWLGLLGLVIDSQTAFSGLLTSVLCLSPPSAACPDFLLPRWGGNSLCWPYSSLTNMEQRTPPATPVPPPNHAVLLTMGDIRFYGGGGTSTEPCAKQGFKKINLRGARILEWRQEDFMEVLQWFRNR